MNIIYSTWRKRLNRPPRSLFEWREEIEYPKRIWTVPIQDGLEIFNVNLSQPRVKPLGEADSFLRSKFFPMRGLIDILPVFQENENPDARTFRIHFALPLRSWSSDYRDINNDFWVCGLSSLDFPLINARDVFLDLFPRPALPDTLGIPSTKGIFRMMSGAGHPALRTHGSVFPVCVHRLPMFSRLHHYLFQRQRISFSSWLSHSW